MYIPLAFIPLLLPLLTTATPAPNPQSSPNSTTSSPAAESNNPNNPDFMQGTNQTLSAWSRSGCGNNTNGAESIYFGNLLYGKNNHALVVSFMLGRDMLSTERLDMSFFVDSKGTKPADGVDPSCGLFPYTASPDQAEQAPLLHGVCYTPSVPVTCVNMWNAS